MSNEVIKYTLSVDGDVSGALSGVKQLQGALQNVKMPADFAANLTKDFDKLKDSLTKFKTLAEKTSFSKADLKQMEKLQSEIDSTFSHLSSSISDLNGKTIYLDADWTKIKEADAEIDRIKTNIQNKLSELKFDIGTDKSGKVNLGLDKIVNDMERGVRSSKVLSSAMQEVQQSISAGNFTAASQQLSDIFNKAEQLKGASTGLLTIFRQWGIISFEGQAKDIAKTQQGVDLLKDAWKALKPVFEQDEAALQALAGKLKDAIDKKKELEATGQKNMADYAEKKAAATDRLAASTHQATQAQKEYNQSVLTAQDQVKQLQQSTQYFFSLRNMINLLKRGLREALQTIKDLDKAMTETAVVTRYSVSDMWAKLPEYTANANALGATIQDMYESTTLYYQQGLNTQQAMSIATETMKMARIAGLEAKDATDMMTAALRGFNMEINETSASHINDVYSNLAANTASNTQEIGKAMQRTASIAHSAGMSFEGTAAFLAQAIETTREPAENLGTAMKTIIARFQELKKNPLEITEVEGEEVSYNKIDTALQSIGVSLKDANGQFRDLDEVFLEISAKWNDLSQTQQRYIATTAAGSRQQSRFIAMMSDYERTVELMGYANNSAGASQEQFSKTLESLEAKLNRFQNAWKEFLMGILNDKWTKRLVDGATTALNLINKLINALSFNGKAGLLKSALSIFTAFTALKFTGRFANKMIGGLGGMIDPTSSFGIGFKQGGIKTGGGQAKAISDPIVQAVNRIYNVISKNATSPENLKYTGQGSYYQGFRAQQQAFRQTVKSGGTLGQAFGTFNGLDKRQISSILNNNVGMEQQLQRTVNGYIQGLNIEDGTKKLISKSIPGMFKAFKNDPQMSGEQFLKSFRLDQLGKLLAKQPGMQAMGQQLVDQYKNQYIDFYKQRFNDWSKAAADEYGDIQAKDINGKTRHQNLLATDSKYRESFNQYGKEGVNKFNGALSNGLLNQKIADPTILNKMAQGASVVGSAFTTAGMAVTSFGMALSNAGFETFGGIITQLGTSLSGFGTIISSVAMTATAAVAAGIESIGAFLSFIWPFAVAIIAIIGTIYALDKVIETNKEKLEAAADAATAASEAYDAAKQSASELAEAIEQIRETQSSFDGLVAGTTEFNDQLLKANEQILNLIDKYPLLMEEGKDYITTDKNGLMHISEAGIKAVEEYEKTLQAHASAVSLIQNADLSLLENQQKANDLRNQKKSYNTEEDNARLDRDADLLEKQAESQQKMARLNAIQTVLTDKNIRNNQKLASILVDQYDTKRAIAEVELGSDKHEIRQKYADYHGYTYEKSTKKIKDKDGNEIDYDDAAIKDEMIEATVLLEFEADAASLENTLSHVDSKFASSLEDTFSNKAHFITDILTKDIETDEDLIREVLADDQHFQDLVNNLSREEIAAILGANATDITDSNIEQYKQEVVSKLTQNSQDIADAQVESYAQLSAMIAKSRGWTTAEASAYSVPIRAELRKFTSEQIHLMSNIGSQLEQYAGADAMTEYINHMTKLYTQTNRGKFGNIDLNNRENWFNPDGSVSTVSGTYGEFGVNGKIGIAFTPYLQTGTGTPKKLTPEEYNKYLEDIVEEAGGNKEKILQADKDAYGIIAEVSEDATKDRNYIEVAESMHNIEELRLGAKEIQGILKASKMDTALGRLKAYNKLSKGTFKTTRELSKTLKTLPSSANLVGQAFNEFLDGDWNSLSENLDSIQNSFGQIDGAGIMEAAKSSDQLNTLLESGVTSAGGLAMALQGIVDGKYTIDDVNQTVLGLLSSLTRVEDAALEAHKIIENFDAGIDYGEADDFMKDNAEKVQEYMDNGEWGNQQLQNYVKLAAGQDLWNDTLKENKGDLEATVKELSKYVTTFKDGTQPVLEQLISNEGINGKSLTDNIKEALDEGRIDEELADKFSKIKPHLDGDQFYFAPEGETVTELTTDEVITYLEEIYGVSEEYAQLIFESWANLSPDLLQELQKNDFKAYVEDKDGTNGFKETHFNEETGQYIFSDAEMQAYAAARGLENVDEAYAEIAEYLPVTAEELQKNEMHWFDKNTNQRWAITGAEGNQEIFADYVEKFFNTTGKDFLNSPAYNKDGQIELGNVIADAVARGADKRQAAEIAWTATEQYGGTGEFYYEGQLINMDDFATFDEFYEHLDQLKETSQWVEIGRAIAQGMEEYQQQRNQPPKPEGEGTGEGNKGTEGKGSDNGGKESESKIAPGIQKAEDRDDTIHSNKSVLDMTIAEGISALFTHISDSAKKQAEITEAYQNVQGQSVEEMQQSSKDWWSNAWNWFIGNNTEGSTSETSDNLSTGSESLIEATNQLTSAIEPLSTAGDGLKTGSELLTEVANQLTSAIESLSTAGDNLNTSAQNLTNAAAILATINPNGSTGTSNGGTAGPPAPGQQSSASGIVIVDNSPALASFDELQQKAADTKTQIETPMSVSVNVSDSGLENAANRVKTINEGSGDKNISVTATSSDPAPVDTLREAIEKFNALGDDEVKLTTTLSGASASSIDTVIKAIDDFHKKTNHEVTLTVNYKTTGTKTEDHDGEAHGVHNHGYASSPPSLGSMARGNYGQLGPKGKGGLTLTGELGYEIAWIPSENRSMILGANGPQMVNLPGDAVVWTHEQSKQMMKQKAIPAGSHFRISYNSNAASNSTTVSTGAQRATQSVINTANKVGKVSVWWENIARKVEATQRKADQAYSKFERYIKQLNATLKGTATKGGGDEYIANMSKIIGYNNAQYKKANRKLEKLDTENKKYTIKYGKGNKKSKDVKLSKYIKKDKDGTYIIDQKKLNKDAKNEKLGKSYAKAVKEAIEKKLGTNIDRRNKAEDEMKKAQEAINKFGQELYEAFFNWKNELTQILDLTRKIEEAQKRISNLDAYSDLIDAKLGSGQISGSGAAEDSIENFNRRLEEQQEVLDKREEAIKESRKQLKALLNSSDEKKTLNAVKAKLKDKNLSDTERIAYEEWQSQLEQQIKAQQIANDLMTVEYRADGTVSIDFDQKKLEDMKLAGDITGEEYNRIKEYIDSINELSGSITELNEQQIAGITEFYSTLADLKEQWAEYGDELLNITNEAEQKKIDDLKKLSSSIKNTLDKLFKKVKDELDRRRKQEDNAKTEKDISQKQQRLAALRADTAGGHQVEIAQLEKEIADAQQDYQRTLEDQLLDEMQKQADEAAEQREKQIALQESLLGTVKNIALVEMWMANPEAFEDEMRQAYYDAKGYDNAASWQKERIETDFNKLYAGLSSNQEEQVTLLTQIRDYLKPKEDKAEDRLEGQELTLEEAKSSGMSLKEAREHFTAATYRDLKEQGGYTAKDFFKADVSLTDAINAGFSAKALREAGYKGNAKAIQDYKDYVEKVASNGKLSVDEFKKVQTYANAVGYKAGTWIWDLAKTKGLTWMEVLPAAKGAGFSLDRLLKTFGGKKNFIPSFIQLFGLDLYRRIRTSKNWNKIEKYETKYATGGLADFTGPAWLDGTPSKPELVLNARDTQNFIALKDVLSKAIGSTGEISSGYGDILYEININVDKIEKDYDVDRVVDRVKKEIVKTSGYRNVTQVRNLR